MTIFRIRHLKTSAALYFLGLGLFNIGLDISVGTFSVTGILLLLILALPMFVSGKLFQIGYGLLGMMLSGYVGLMSLNAFFREALSLSDILMGFAMIGGFFVASGILFVNGIRSSESGRFDFL